MKNFKKIIAVLIVAVLAVSVLSLGIFAAADDAADTADTATADTADTATVDDGSTKSKAIAAATCVGLAAAAGAVSMCIAISKSADGIARQPEAAENLRGSLMLGLVFIETVVIYALIVAILIVFVL